MVSKILTVPGVSRLIMSFFEVAMSQRVCKRAHPQIHIKVFMDGCKGSSI